MQSALPVRLRRRAVLRAGDAAVRFRIAREAPAVGQALDFEADLSAQTVTYLHGYCATEIGVGVVITVVAPVPEIALFKM
jgi:hypothetical protein